MKFKQKSITFAANVTTDGISHPDSDGAGRNSVQNNISTSFSDQFKRGSGSLSSEYELPQSKKKKGFIKTYGSVVVWFAILMCIAAIVVPCVLLLTVYVSTTLIFPYGDCVLLEEYRTPCTTAYSEVGQRECEAVSCCWDPGSRQCYHSIPARHAYLWTSTRETKRVSADMDFDLSPRLSRTPLLTTSYPRLRAAFRFASATRLRIVVGTPGSSAFADVASSSANDSSFVVRVSGPAFTFEVYRRGDNSSAPLVSTTRSPLIASDNYWEIGLRCPPGGTVYGLGGLGLENTTLLYSSSSRSASFPYLMCLGEEGDAHGLLIQNYGPLEVSFNNKSNVVILRAISNLGWDINILAGPRPRDVVNQLTEIVGRPRLPPFWVLGFHVCRDSSDGTNSTQVNATAILSEFIEFHNRSISQGLPYDSDCIHERLLGDLNFSASAEVFSELAVAFDALQASGKKFLLSLPPQVSEAQGDCFLRRADGSLYSGEYRGRPVHYPDFAHPGAGNWTASNLRLLSAAAGNVSAVLAGFVLADNWPQDDSPGREAEDLPYLPQAANGSLSRGTVQWSARHYGGRRHYELHNSYGRLQGEALVRSAALHHAAVLGGSCGPGATACANQGSAAPQASWAGLRRAVVSVLGAGLAGVPLAGGGPLCAGRGDADPTLCLRWYSLGATLPLARGLDPPLGGALLAAGVLESLRLRYSLLPYYGSLLAEAGRSGEPLARPMFYEFPRDPAARRLDEQFMVGPALLAAPALRADLAVVRVYLPAGEPWYLLEGGLPVSDGLGARSVPLASGGARPVLLLRGGHVLPTQEPGADARSSRLGRYKLVVALACAAAGDCSAAGHVTSEEDVTVTFRASSASLAVGNLREACSRAQLPSLAEVTVMRPAGTSAGHTPGHETTRNTATSHVSTGSSGTSADTSGPSTAASASIEPGATTSWSSAAEAAGVTTSPAATGSSSSSASASVSADGSSGASADTSGPSTAASASIEPGATTSWSSAAEVAGVTTSPAAPGSSSSSASASVSADGSSETSADTSGSSTATSASIEPGATTSWSSAAEAAGVTTSPAATGSSSSSASASVSADGSSGTSADTSGPSTAASASIEPGATTSWSSAAEAAGVTTSPAATGSSSSSASASASADGSSGASGGTPAVTSGLTVPSSSSQSSAAPATSSSPGLGSSSSHAEQHSGTSKTSLHSLNRELLVPYRARAFAAERDSSSLGSGQTVTYKFNNTSLCVGEDTIIINFT
ncbi:probable maltase-glucoamylase 2 [Bacillus rossius redtenbacheri]|uniref:probable maltase-glucoamylase 2 n=1 Tax=Bacillus rossius redtenbacheri TaxID=93214 RepID=UPI002FDDE8D4